MKTPTVRTLLALIAAASTTAFGFTYKNDPTWATFKNKYLKRYDTIDEEIYRYKIFLENMELASHYNDAEDEASYGMTQFSDKLSSELYTEITAPPFAARIEPAPEVLGLGELPDNFDWRLKGAVTHVKNQGSCGSCWAFSAVGCVEGAHFVNTSKLVALSEQELLDCELTSMGCNGGWAQVALEWAKKGVMNETAYPYKAVKGTCAFDESKVVAKVTNIYGIMPNMPSKMQENIVAHGPISISLDATKFHAYLGGIMNGTDCSKITANHAVLLVGWGVEASTGTKYWIIKNSWGPTWGENGYIRIVRGSNACNVERLAIAAAAN